MNFRFKKLLPCTFLLSVLLLPSDHATAQISPEEHSQHHPEQAAPENADSGTASPETTVESGGGMGGGKGGGGMGGGMGGGKGGGGMGGGMGGGKGGGGMGGGGMGGRRGPSEPEEMYPRLMTLPTLTQERRAELERQAHDRMLDGTAILSEGFDELSDAAIREDFQKMQDATARLREGLMQFESGLAAQRAMQEGKAPRNVALQWFNSELNLLPLASEEQRFTLWGMQPFHATIMLLLGIFMVTMIWMYVLKMRRAADLLQRLNDGEGLGTEGSPAESQNLPPPAISTTPQTASGKPKKWSGKLRLAGVFQETPDVKTFRFVDPEGGSLPFTYLPGQFLTLTVEPGGKPIKRSYTIASSPTQRDYLEITVKREEKGVVSRFLHDGLKPNDLIDVSAPAGNLTFTGEDDDCIVLIAAGVGVTPIMSVTRYLTDRCWEGDIYVLFVCRTAEDIIFKDEFEERARKYPSMKLYISLSRANDGWTGPTGRLSGESISAFVPDIAQRRVHICGPNTMMNATKEILIDLGLSKDQIKTEAFGPAKKGAPKKETKEAAPASSDTATVTFSASNKAAPLPQDQTVLDVADELGVDIENSCRAGSCGSCKVKLLQGSVTMETEDALEPEEKSDGIILACQAVADSDIVVDV